MEQIRVFGHKYSWYWKDSTVSVIFCPVLKWFLKLSQNVFNVTFIYTGIPKISESINSYVIRLSQG